MTSPPRRYRVEAGKLVRRPAVRANGLDAAALLQASCARIQALRLRHGAPDWKTASGGLESSWKGGSGFVRALRTRQSATLPTFDFPGFPMPQSGLPNLPGTATGRAAGLAAHEVRFGAAADTPLNARRASPAVSKVRRGSALLCALVHPHLCTLMHEAPKLLDSCVRCGRIIPPFLMAETPPFTD